MTVIGIDLVIGKLLFCDLPYVSIYLVSPLHVLHTRLLEITKIL